MNVYSFARELNLYVGTWSPGDGMKRYRFFKDGVVTAKGEPVQDFHSSDGLFTAGGKGEALTWLRGYRKGKEG